MRTTSGVSLLITAVNTNNRKEDIINLYHYFLNEEGKTDRYFQGCTVIFGAMGHLSPDPPHSARPGRVLR